MSSAPLDNRDRHFRDCFIAEGIFWRWIIVYAHNSVYAWAGNSWDLHERGIPAGRSQICNFESAADAEKYASDYGLKIVRVLGPNMEGRTMSITFDAWLKQLRTAAVEGFFMSPEAAESLGPVRRRHWMDYYEQGWGPLAALEEDLEVPESNSRMPTFDVNGKREEPQ